LASSLAGVDCPDAFEAAFVGPDGEYRLAYRLNADSGLIETKIGGVEMTWIVDFVEKTAEGHWELGGLTRGSQDVWGDTYWFEMRTAAGAPLNLWGDQILLRSDPPV